MKEGAKRLKKGSPKMNKGPRGGGTSKGIKEKLHPLASRSM